MRVILGFLLSIAFVTAIPSTALWQNLEEIQQRAQKLCQVPEEKTSCYAGGARLISEGSRVMIIALMGMANTMNPSVTDNQIKHNLCCEEDLACLSECLGVAPSSPLLQNLQDFIPLVFRFAPQYFPEELLSMDPEEVVGNAEILSLYKSILLENIHDIETTVLLRNTVHI